MLFIVLFFGVFPGCSDLVRVVKIGDVGGVEKAIKGGADVNDTDKTGSTALMEAVMGGHADMIPLLLKAGANVNARDKGGVTALMLAASKGQVTVIPLLLKAGGDVNASNAMGDTALMEATSYGHANVIPPLLRAGADVNARDKGGDTALMWAVMGGHANVIPLLLRAGADVNAKDKDGLTALMEAAMGGHAKVIPLLLKAGADVNARDKDDVTALMEAAQNGRANAIPLLLKGGADVNARNTNGLTALMEAAQNGRTNAIPLLLKSGADVNATDKFGFTAENRASGDSRSEIISLLDDWKVRHSGTAVAKNSTSSTGALPSAPSISSGFSQTEAQNPSTGKVPSVPSTSSGISQSEAQNIAAQAAKQALEQAKLEFRNNRTGPKNAPTYHSSVDRPAYSEPRHRKDFALVIGVEKYPEPIHPATFADRDAQSMFAHLRALGVPVRHIKRLTGDTATKSRIESALHWLKRNVQAGATVYVYFSGHGAPGRSGHAYLVPFDGDPSDLSETALTVSTLYQDLETLPAKHVIVALDACFTGEGNRSVLGSGIRPLVTKIKEGAVPASGKLVVLTATRSDQESGILDSKGHGLFTYYLLKGLNGRAEHGGHVTVASLYRYLKPKVQSEASLDNRSQTPELEPTSMGSGTSVRLR